MAKGYLADSVSLEAARTSSSLGVVPPAQAFTQNRKLVHSIAEKVVSDGRPGDSAGWVWIQSADC